MHAPVACDGLVFYFFPSGRMRHKSWSRPAGPRPTLAQFSYCDRKISGNASSSEGHRIEYSECNRHPRQESRTRSIHKQW